MLYTHPALHSVKAKLQVDWPTQTVFVRRHVKILGEIKKQHTFSTLLMDAHVPHGASMMEGVLERSSTKSSTQI